MVRSIWPPPRVQRFAITAAPSAPTPSSRYTARLGRGLLGLNLAGVIRSGTTWSGLSWHHAWTAGCASRFSRRFSDRARVGVRLGGAGVGRASTAAGVVSATTLPPSMVSNAEQPASVVGRSEEHTSELQSRLHLVCRLLLE